MASYWHDYYNLDSNEDVDEIKSVDMEERQEIMETFRKSGLHGEDWPKVVFAVLVCTFIEDGNINTRQKFRSRNSEGIHAEEKIVDFLGAKLQNMRVANRQVIALYVSYSPCGRCSNAISGLVEEMKRRVSAVKLQISFPALYKIIRPSCLAGRHPVRHTLPDAEEHHYNLHGLEHLLYNNVDLQTFEEHHWRNLSTLLSVPVFHEHNGYDQCLACFRRLEDEKMKDDFEDLTWDVNRRAGRQVEQPNRGRLRTPIHVSVHGVSSSRFQENGTARRGVNTLTRTTPVTSRQVGISATTHSTRMTSRQDGVNATTTTSRRFGVNATAHNTPMTSRQFGVNSTAHSTTMTSRQFGVNVTAHSTTPRTQRHDEDQEGNRPWYSWCAIL